MSEPTNADLLGVLMTIKEDIGGLKTSSTLQLKALENHSGRLGSLEQRAASQKGAARVWTLVVSGASAVVGSGVALFAAWWQKH